MPDKPANGLTAKSEQGSLELTEELIQQRAYYFYEKRGCEDGHDLDDWLQAEAEIVGKKPAATAGSEPTKGRRKAAAA